MPTESAATHPRPQLRRGGWESLDGPWDFAFDRDGRWHHPSEVPFDRKITVPFAPETEMSGVFDPNFTKAVWYRRRYKPPELAAGERLVLHFGAVDYQATVFVDGRRVMWHEGGFTPFDVDLTRFVLEGRELELAVLAVDDPHDLAKPRGKQDWLRKPHSIWYPRTTGIWQTVWVERLPRASISRIHWSSNLERWEIELVAWVEGECEPGQTLRVRLDYGSETLVDDTYTVDHAEVHRRIALSDPRIDDSRNRLLWSPTRPTLIDARIELVDRNGQVIDTVHSYTALRTITVQDDQILLNGRPIQLKMVLDQGYWPQSGLTAPDENAFRRDIDLVKQMGFNGVRKHQKIEDERFLFEADRLGLFVWEEMPSAYRFTGDSIRRLVREWTDVIQRDISHPCIIAWVPLNESWGVPSLPEVPAQRHYVKALYHLTKTLDPTRPVVGNDGWESVATDIIGVHDYDPDPGAIRQRYHAEEVRPRLYRRQRYGGRLMVLDGHDHDHPIILSEFGGLALADPDDTLWGYAVALTPQDLEKKLKALLEAVRRVPLLAGYCYTQLTDTYQEANGLLYADRTPKVPLERIFAMNTANEVALVGPPP